MECAQRKNALTILCTSCGKELHRDQFDAANVAKWKRERNFARDACCVECARKPRIENFECTICKKTLRREAFDTVSLCTWIRNRDITKRAKCKECAGKSNTKIKSLPHRWAQELYTCSQCRKDQKPSEYNYEELAKLENDSQCYLARCEACRSGYDLEKFVRCNLCRAEKQAKLFTPQRRRCKNFATWRCIACDFPPCTKCGKEPDMPKQKPYICHPCMFPPCACGAKRPESTKYRVTNRPVWTCSACSSK